MSSPVSAFLVKEEGLCISLDSQRAELTIDQHDIAFQIRRDDVVPLGSVEDNINAGGSDAENKLCVVLKEFFFPPTETGVKMNRETLDLLVSVRLVQVKPNNPQYTMLLVTLEGNFLRDLSFLFGEDGVTLTFILSDISIQVGTYPWPIIYNLEDVEIAEMLPQSLEDGDVFFCGAKPILGQNSSNLWTVGSAASFVGRVSVALTRKIDTALVAHQSRETHDPLQVIRKMLHDNIGMDMNLQAKNGTLIPCHKSFLAVHSNVLRDFVETEIEQNNNVLALEDVSEDGARALLAYLYYGDLEWPRRDCQVALELLHTSTKFGIFPLDNLVRDILLKEPVDTFPVSVAFHLFYYYFVARQNSTLIDLQKKAISVMKLKRDELNALEEYSTLFAEKPVAAKLLCDSLLSI